MTDSMVKERVNVSIKHDMIIKGIPQVTDLDTAIRIYYRFPEIGTVEMTALFGKKSKSTINKLKNMARLQMIKDDICTNGLYKLNTAAAYRAWGIDVDDLEKRRQKLLKLGLQS